MGEYEDILRKYGIKSDKSVADDRNESSSEVNSRGMDYGNRNGTKDSTSRYRQSSQIDRHEEAGRLNRTILSEKKESIEDMSSYIDEIRTDRQFESAAIEPTTQLADKTDDEDFLQSGVFGKRTSIGNNIDDWEQSINDTISNGTLDNIPTGTVDIQSEGINNNQGVEGVFSGTRCQRPRNHTVRPRRNPRPHSLITSILMLPWLDIIMIGITIAGLTLIGLNWDYVTWVLFWWIEGLVGNILVFLVIIVSILIAFSLLLRAIRRR